MTKRNYSLEIIYSNGVLIERKIGKGLVENILKKGPEYLKAKFYRNDSVDIISFQIWDENGNPLISPTGEDYNEEKSFEEISSEIYDNLINVDSSNFNEEQWKLIQQHIERAHEFLSSKYNNAPELIFHVESEERCRYDLETNKIHLNKITLLSEVQCCVYHDYRSVILRVFKGEIKQHSSELFLILEKKDCYLSSMFVYTHEFAHFLNDTYLKKGKPFEEHNWDFVYAFREVLDLLSSVFPDIKKYAFSESEV